MEKPSAPWSASSAYNKATPSGSWPGVSVSCRISSPTWNEGTSRRRGNRKIVLIAEILEQNTDELLALAGKVSSDLIEIILQRPKETAALLRRLRHVPASKIAAAKDQLAATEPLEFYPLETVSGENHTAMVGESGSGKSLLTKYLIHSYFRDAHVRVLRCTSLSRQVEAKIKIGCYAYEPKYTAAGVW